MKLGDGTVRILAVSLKEDRTKARMTQAQLAELLEVDDQHVYKLEAGLRNITASLIARCVDVFGSCRFARVGKAGERRYVVVPEEAFKPDRPRSSRIPVDLTLGERVVRVGKEARDVLGKAVQVNKYMIALHRNPGGASGYVGQIAKELADLLAWGEDLMAHLHQSFDEDYHEAESASARELAAECGEVPA